MTRIVGSTWPTALGLVILSVVPAVAEPSTSYVIRSGTETVKYTLSKKGDDAYFFEMAGATYRFVASGRGLTDSQEARRQIMRALETAYVNPRVATLAPDKALKLKRRGVCVPSLLKTNGQEGLASFAIDFVTEHGLLKGFVVGSSLQCSVAVKF